MITTNSILSVKTLVIRIISQGIILTPLIMLNACLSPSYIYTRTHQWIDIDRYVCIEHFAVPVCKVL